MKRYIWLTLLSLITLAAFQAMSQQVKVRAYKGYYYVPYDPARMRFGLTPEEAQQRLLRWMNSPGLQLRLIGVTSANRNQLEDPSTWENAYFPDWHAGHQPSYLFEDNQGREYVVAIVPIELWTYTDPSTELTDEGEDASQWLPREQLRAAAEQFLAQRVPNLLAEPHNEKQRYGRFAVDTPYQGVIHNRLAIVYVHKRLGVVRECYWHDPGQPVGLSTVPSLSQSQARQLALDFASQMPGVLAVEVDESIFRCSFGVFTDVMGTSRLLWSFPVKAVRTTDSPMVADFYIIAVDAHTGDVFLVDESLSRSAQRADGNVASLGTKKKQEVRVLKISFGETDVSDVRTLLMLQPLQIDGDVYLWTGWLRSPLFGVADADVKYDPSSRTVHVRFQGKSWQLTAGSQWLASREKRIALSRPVLCLRRRIYVPLEAIRHITGWQAEVTEDTVVLRRPGVGRR